MSVTAKLATYGRDKGVRKNTWEHFPIYIFLLERNSLVFFIFNFERIPNGWKIPDRIMYYDPLQGFLVCHPTPPPDSLCIQKICCDSNIPREVGERQHDKPWNFAPPQKSPQMKINFPKFQVYEISHSLLEEIIRIYGLTAPTQGSKSRHIITWN